MYLEEKSIVCTTFNVCLICRASIKLRVCLSFMSWRKQSGFYLRERHFKDLSICYQVKLNNQPLNAVCSRCSNIFHLHMTGSMWACGKETDLLIFTLKQCYAFRLDGWVSSRCIYQGVASIYGEPKWSLYFALGLSSPPWFRSSSGQHEWTEHCGCPGERELHLNFWVPYPNSTSYKV